MAVAVFLFGTGALPAACPNDCMGRGSCHDGQCECQPGYTYFDCSLRAPRPPVRFGRPAPSPHSVMPTRATREAA